MFAVALHYAAFLFLFVVVPRCTKWLRGKATPMSIRSWQKMRRTCPAACRRMEFERERLSVFCTLMWFSGQIATSSARYGLLCGWIVLLLQIVPIHGTAEQSSSHAHREGATHEESRHCRAPEAAQEESRHCRGQGLIMQHGTAEGGLGCFWEPESVNGNDSAVRMLHRRQLLGGHLPGGMRKGFLSPRVMKKPAAASSSNSNVEDAQALVQRKAREAEQVLHGFASKHQLDTAVRCEFTDFKAGGQGIGMLACFKWTMTRPSGKLYLFDHDHPVEAKTDPVRLAHLRAGQSVPEPEGWKMLLRWEQFHNVAADAQKRAKEKFGMPIQCEYIGAYVTKGRAGGAPTYEPNPAEWPASVLRDGRASNVEIYFRFWSTRGSEFVSIRVDHLQDQQLALPSSDVCEATVVRRQPRMGPEGEQVDMYIDAALVAEYDEAYARFRASAEERQLTPEQRRQEFQSLADTYSRDVQKSWTKVAQWAEDNNLQVRFVMASDHDRLCALHKKIFDIEHSVGRAEASAHAPLRVLWAHVLEAFSADAQQDAQDVKARPRSLLLRRPPTDYSIVNDFRKRFNWFTPEQDRVVQRSPCNWTWHSSYSDFVTNHVHDQDFKLYLCQNLVWEDVSSFAAFLMLRPQIYWSDASWVIPWTSVVLMPTQSGIRDVMIWPNTENREHHDWSLCTLCASALLVMDAHPEWPSLACLVEMCRRQQMKTEIRPDGLQVRRSSITYDPPHPFPMPYLEFRDSVLRCRDQPPDFETLWGFTGDAAGVKSLFGNPVGVRRVEFLLNSRADIDQPTPLGFTMVHAAAAFARLEVVTMLCSAAANLNIACAGGFTALHLATGCGHAINHVLSDTFPVPHELHLDDGGTGPRVWHGVCIKGAQYFDKKYSAEMCRVLCEARASPNAAANDGMTPLHCALLAGNAPWLIEPKPATGAFRPAEGPGLPGLHAAHVQAAEVLLKAKARLDARDRDGTTPLHIMMHLAEDGTLWLRTGNITEYPPEIVDQVLRILHDAGAGPEIDGRVQKLEQDILARSTRIFCGQCDACLHDGQGTWCNKWYARAEDLRPYSSPSLRNWPG